MNYLFLYKSDESVPIHIAKLQKYDDELIDKLMNIIKLSGKTIDEKKRDESMKELYNDGYFNDYNDYLALSLVFDRSFDIMSEPKNVKLTSEKYNKLIRDKSNKEFREKINKMFSDTYKYIKNNIFGFELTSHNNCDKDEKSTECDINDTIKEIDNCIRGELITCNVDRKLMDGKLHNFGYSTIFLITNTGDKNIAEEELNIRPNYKPYIPRKHKYVWASFPIGWNTYAIFTDTKYY